MTPDRLSTQLAGTYQGSVISPILANIYLHEVLDLWIEREVKPKACGQVMLIRYADDFIITFEHKSDAEIVQAALVKRFAEYGLELSSAKTKLIEFGRRALRAAEAKGRAAETFDFLGFCHYCDRTRRGKFTVRVKTMGKRLRRSLKRVATWCKVNMHLDLAAQRRHLNRVLQGHYQYYGRVGNIRSLYRFYRGVIVHWRRALGRRGAPMPWCRFLPLLRRYSLALPRITEQWATKSC